MTHFAQAVRYIRTLRTRGKFGLRLDDSDEMSQGAPTVMTGASKQNERAS